MKSLYKGLLIALLHVVIVSSFGAKFRSGALFTIPICPFAASTFRSVSRFQPKDLQSKIKSTVRIPMNTSLQTAVIWSYAASSC